PARRRWAAQPPGVIKFADADARSEKALRIFYDELRQFDSLLTLRKQKHLLYIQPHLAFRDTSVMSLTERALYNYYTATYNDPFNNLFKRKILIETDSFPPNVKSLSALTSSREPVFVDYCHFTLQANKYIAATIADEILQYP
ncbi:MAG: hypothetical protein WCF67_21755, partial [Chitinophagaceae bacterium]